MAFTIGDFRRLSLFASSSNSISVGADEYWGARVLLVVSDEPVSNPHDWLRDTSYSHFAFLNFGPRALDVEYSIHSAHAAIGFDKNGGEAKWGGFEHVRTIDPLFEVPEGKYINYNCSRLIPLSIRDELKMESLQAKCLISPEPDNIRSTEFDLDVSILLDLPIHDQDGAPTMPKDDRFACFISYASEDKDTIAAPIAKRLQYAGIKIWFDDFELTLGDSIRASLDEGLKKSEYGIVVLSPNYLRKFWAQEELDGIFAERAASGNRLLPILHNLTIDELRRHSPILAGKVAISTQKGIDTVIEAILKAIT